MVVFVFLDGCSTSDEGKGSVGSIASGRKDDSIKTSMRISRGLMNRCLALTYKKKSD